MPGSSDAMGHVLWIGRRGRLWFGLLAATVLLAAVAVPAFAAKPTKIYHLDLSAASKQAVAGQAADFFVTVENTTPGNSNANSFSVILPEGFQLTFNGVNPDAGIDPDPDLTTNPNTSATVTGRDNVNVIVPPSTTPVARDVVDVQSLDPLKTSQTVTLRINATAPAINGCTSDRYWFAQVWTGSSLSGDGFTLDNGSAPGTPGPNQQTTVVSCLQLSFVDGFAPTNGTTGEAQDVKVEVLAGTTRVTSFTGPITIDLLLGPTGGELSGNGPEPAVAGVADFASFTGTLSGDYTVGATTTVADVSNSDDVSFTLYDGILDCGDTVSEAAGDAFRGPNKDASECTEVNYSFDTYFDADLNKQTVEFIWDTDSQPNAQYKFTIPWPASTDENPVNLPDNRVTQYSIGTEPPRDVLFCDGMSATQTYGGSPVSFQLGDLASPATAIDEAIMVTEVTPSVTPPVPFDIFVESEWMRVTGRIPSGSNWIYTVVRGVNGSPSGHASGADVMLALPNYPSNEQACMSNSTTIGIPSGGSSLEEQTTEEIWVKGDIRMSK